MDLSRKAFRFGSRRGEGAGSVRYSRHDRLDSDGVAIPMWPRFARKSLIRPAEMAGFRN
jgi:hypothetical protein